MIGSVKGLVFISVSAYRRQLNLSELPAHANLGFLQGQNFKRHYCRHLLHQPPIMSVQSVQCFGKKKTGMKLFHTIRKMAKLTGEPSYRRCALQGTYISFTIQLNPSPINVEQAGKGLVKVNGKPLSLLQPEILRFKVSGPVPCPLRPHIHGLTTLPLTFAGLRTSPNSRSRQILGRGHPRTRHWRRPYIPNLRHSPSYCEIYCSLLSEIRG